MMQVAGWGHDGSDNITAALTEVYLPVISNRICIQDTINITGDPSIIRTLTSNMFCAGHAADIPPEGIFCVRGAGHVKFSTLLKRLLRLCHQSFVGMYLK